MQPARYLRVLRHFRLQVVLTLALVLSYLLVTVTLRDIFVYQWIVFNTLVPTVTLLHGLSCLRLSVYTRPSWFLFSKFNAVLTVQQLYPWRPLCRLWPLQSKVQRSWAGCGHWPHWGCHARGLFANVRRISIGPEGFANIRRISIARNSIV